MTILGIVFTVRSGDPRWLFASLPFTLVLFVAGRFAPTGYRLAPEGIQIERKAGAKLIPYRKIRGVDRAERRVNGLTALGSRGVFGRFGRFWNPSLGFYRLYLANRSNLVWLATDDGWVGLSPDRPGEFVERLQGRLAILGRGGA
ncbi:MAG: hypothetical protein HY727_03895 [Candidatus Rokubacteria bacterium]|nr:hypothetical protein [Candidatus Rokubacteria bacterium]